MSWFSLRSFLFSRCKSDDRYVTATLANHACAIWNESRPFVSACVRFFPRKSDTLYLTVTLANHASVKWRQDIIGYGIQQKAQQRNKTVMSACVDVARDLLRKADYSSHVYATNITLTRNKQSSLHSLLIMRLQYGTSRGLLPLRAFVFFDARVTLFI